jgi:predicted Zn finger-like uncharacterized protein
MIIACPACSTRYVVPDSSIGVDGRTVRCAKCRHSWFQDGATPEALVAATSRPAAPRPAAPPPAAAPVARAPVSPPPPSPAPVAAPPPPAPPPPAPPPPAAPAPRAIVEPEPPFSSEPAGLHWPPPTVDPDEPPFSAIPDEPAPVYADDNADRYYDESRSSFDSEPPFRPRRNRLRMWTIAASLFAVVALGAGAAVARYGLPDWMKPLARATFAEAQPDLVLDFPPNRQDRRTLSNGTEFFGASGTVRNVGQTRRAVPTILIVLRDARERIVYSYEVAPPKRVLAPGESMTVNEAMTDVPKTARVAEIGWKPG